MNERPDEIRHNTDATDALDQFAIKRNNDQHDAEIGKAKAETHGIESHANAEKIAAQGVADGIRRKHAAFIALAAGAGIGLACWGASFLLTPEVKVVELEKQVIVKEPVVVKETVIVKEPLIVKETTIVKEPMPVTVPGQPQVAVTPPPSTGGGTNSEPKPDSPVPPQTQAERNFTEKPGGYADATIRGRIVKATDGWLHFDTGQYFFPADGDVENPAYYLDTDPFVGDFGYCLPLVARPNSYDCYASHNGATMPIVVRKRGETGGAPAVPPAWSQPATGTPGSAAPSPFPPRDPTPAEAQFIKSPGYQKTDIHGRIMKSPDGFTRFDNGTQLSPPSNDGRVRSFLTEEFVGDFGFCDNGAPFNCFAFHAGKTVKVPVDPPLTVASPPKPAKPARPINPFPTIDPARGGSA
ncbi:hypothetical protein [Bosea sp. NBC_00550]|uniref:hypothetical protein n=1 Tax=Bosea sp. NBC_00550 TaxID=2969621 RepID=UPI00223183C0|nr:hypothetical protein [Bosea sp. NBC_00550]UZF93021.1 hypothetical protein NWE53_02045 [Bosea sp. NBC_00550]